jgi:hypothetical protein
LPKEPLVLAAVQVVLHAAQQTLELPHLIEHHLRGKLPAQGDAVRFAVGEQVWWERIMRSGYSVGASQGA